MEHHDESSEHESIKSSESKGQGSVRADVPPASCHRGRIDNGDSVLRLVNVSWNAQRHEHLATIYYLPLGENDPSKELCKNVLIDDLLRVEKPVIIEYLRESCNEQYESQVEAEREAIRERSRP